MKKNQIDFTANPPTQAERDRFWAKVQKTDTCWFWTGARLINGYGVLTFRNVHTLAHRLAYCMEYGFMPDNVPVYHSCNSHNCVNPQHLVDGTCQENPIKMHLRGRWKSDRQNPSNVYQKVSRTCLNCGNIFTRTTSVYREEPEPLCNHTCRAEWNWKNTVAYFWSKVDRSHLDGCWNWQGEIHRNGYGAFRTKDVMHKTKDRLAHRVAWRLTYGDIPAGLHILHSCDNPSCVNPAHLRLGTRSDNMQDASRKGRLKGSKPRKKRNVQIPSMRGELHPNSKLTNLQRQEIRDRHAKGESYSVLGKAFGVNKTTIGYIIKPKYH